MSVHNHGPAEGPGLGCPETRTPDGLRGACLPPDAPPPPVDPAAVTWRGERAAPVRFNGKVVGHALDAELVITDRAIVTLIRGGSILALSIDSQP